MTLDLDLPPDWVIEANCVGKDPNLFFSDIPFYPYKEAAKICARCVVRDECLEYALEREEIHGFWGGMSPQGREVLMKSREALRSRKQFR